MRGLLRVRRALERGELATGYLPSQAQVRCGPAAFEHLLREVTRATELARSWWLDDDDFEAVVTCSIAGAPLEKHVDLDPWRCRVQFPQMSGTFQGSWGQDIELRDLESV